jgi:hypothetical protein
LQKGSNPVSHLFVSSRIKSMKEVVVVRHGHWDTVNDQLTEQGKSRCLDVKPILGSAVIAVSSPFVRTRETAQLLSDVEPRTDERASIPHGPPEFGPRIMELRKTHPYGVAGALISIPELREPLYKQGEALLELVKEALAQLLDGQRGLIVSHDYGCDGKSTNKRHIRRD